MTYNTLIDIMLICKGWYNKQLYKDKLSAMQAYYDKYYTYGESQVELTKDFALNLFSLQMTLSVCLFARHLQCFH